MKLTIYQLNCLLRVKINGGAMPPPMGTAHIGGYMRLVNHLIFSGYLVSSAPHALTEKGEAVVGQCGKGIAPCS